MKWLSFLIDIIKQRENYEIARDREIGGKEEKMNTKKEKNVAGEH